MFDELNPETQQFEETPAEQPKAEEKKPEQPAQESQKEANMRILRERAENAERRIQDSERRNQELERVIQMNMNQNQQSTKMQITDDRDDIDLDDDTYIEGKQFKKYVRGLKQELKDTKKQFAEMHQQNALSNAEYRLKSQFTDFDSVVNEDNLKKLSSQKPALFRSIMANQDIYDRGYTAYEMIKNSSILTDEYAAVDKKLEDNKSKPRAVANAAPQSGDTPLTRVGDYDRRILTEERKAQLRKQVEEARRNR